MGKGSKSQKKNVAAAAAAAAASTGAPGPKTTQKSSSSSWSSLYLVAAAAVALLALLPMLGDNTSSPDAPSTDKKMSRFSKSQIRDIANKAPCKNKHEDEECHYFASRGHCEEAPGWMAVFCAASCDACELRDPKVRCDASRIGYDPSDAWKPGSVDQLFESLPERWPQYNVTFLSKPPAGPWVAKFHNFISQEEIDALIDQADGNLRRSTDQGGFGDDGVQEQVTSKGRTSMNAWCMGECEKHPLIMGVSKRIEDVTGVPEDNYESFQILRYEKGQEYVRHHDSTEDDNNLLAGPRILTFYLYLSDVEEGGGTQFTDLDPPLTNHPEKGSAILWPSVYNDNPTKVDPRTHHAALPVLKGVKFGANHWIHLRNYKIPNLHGCTGSFTE